MIYWIEVKTEHYRPMVVLTHKATGQIKSATGQHPESRLLLISNINLPRNLQAPRMWVKAHRLKEKSRASGLRRGLPFLFQQLLLSTIFLQLLQQQPRWLRNFILYFTQENQYSDALQLSKTLGVADNLQAMFNSCITWWSTATRYIDIAFDVKTVCSVYSLSSNSKQVEVMTLAGGCHKCHCSAINYHRRLTIWWRWCNLWWEPIARWNMPYTKTSKKWQTSPYQLHHLASSVVDHI